MFGNIFSNDNDKEIDFVNPPESESSTDGFEKFSADAQREKFLGGSSGNKNYDEKSGLRVRKGLEISRFDIKKPTVEGLENLPDIPCVVATTHLSDIDVGEIAMAIAERRKIGIVSQETNLNFIAYKPFIAAIGRENFFSVANAPYNKKQQTAYSLRFEDLQKMTDGIKDGGRTMVVAGHTPTHNWELAERPGIAAVILAHMANAPLVPAVLDIDSKTAVAQSTDIKTRIKNFVRLRRPNSKIIFGEPMNLPEISVEKLHDVINLYSPDQRRNMTAQQITETKGTLEILQKEATEMMERFAANLPLEKRGKWGKENSSNQTSQPTT